MALTVSNGEPRVPLGEIRRPRNDEFWASVLIAEVALVRLSPCYNNHDVDHEGRRGWEKAPQGAGDIGSAPRGLAVESRGFLRPVQDSPPAGVRLGARRPRQRQCLLKRYTKLFRPTPPRGRVQPVVPCGGTPVAAKASQPAVPHNGQWQENPSTRARCRCAARARREAEAQELTIP